MYNYTEKVTDMEIATYEKARQAVEAIDELKEIKQKMENQQKVTITLTNDVIRTTLVKAITDQLNKQEKEFNKL